MTTTMNKLVTLVSDVTNLIKPLIDILSTLVGKNSFSTLINCKFIGLNLNNIAVTFGTTFSKPIYQIGNYLIAISFMTAAMIIFTLMMINYTKDLENNGNKVMELDSEMKSLTGKVDKN